MIEYKFNKMMQHLANRNGVSFENEFVEYKLPAELNHIIQNGIQRELIEQNVYYKFRDTVFEFFYKDITGNEVSNKKVVFERSKYDKYTLKKGFSFCHKLSRILPSACAFDIIMSIDESYVMVSFNMLREGESWLRDDLEEYKSEAILVMTCK